MPRDLSGFGYAKSRQISRVCATMHSTNGDDDPHTGPPESEAQNGTAEVLSAAHYLRLAEECMSLAALTKDPEKAAELIKTGDDYLRRASQLISDHLKGR
jgi:hypothetical protein